MSQLYKNKTAAIQTETSSWSKGNGCHKQTNCPKEEVAGIEQMLAKDKRDGCPTIVIKLGSMEARENLLAFLWQEDNKYRRGRNKSSLWCRQTQCGPNEEKNHMEYANLNESKGKKIVSQMTDLLSEHVKIVHKVGEEEEDKKEEEEEEEEERKQQKLVQKLAKKTKATTKVVPVLTNKSVDEKKEDQNIVVVGSSKESKESKESKGKESKESKEQKVTKKTKATKKIEESLSEQVVPTVQMVPIDAHLKEAQNFRTKSTDSGTAQDAADQYAPGVQDTDIGGRKKRSRRKRKAIKKRTRKRN